MREEESCFHNRNSDQFDLPVYGYYVQDNRDFDRREFARERFEPSVSPINYPVMPPLISMPSTAQGQSCLMQEPADMPDDLRVQVLMWFLGLSPEQREKGIVISIEPRRQTDGAHDDDVGGRY